MVTLYVENSMRTYLCASVRACECVCKSVHIHMQGYNDRMINYQILYMQSMCLIYVENKRENCP